MVVLMTGDIELSFVEERWTFRQDPQKYLFLKIACEKIELVL